MKKTYSQPLTEVILFVLEQCIAGSPGGDNLKERDDKPVWG